MLLHCCLFDDSDIQISQLVFFCMFLSLYVHISILIMAIYMSAAGGGCSWPNSPVLKRAWDIGRTSKSPLVNEFVWNWTMHQPLLDSPLRAYTWTWFSRNGGLKGSPHMCLVGHGEVQRNVKIIERHIFPVTPYVFFPLESWKKINAASQAKAHFGLRKLRMCELHFGESDLPGALVAWGRCT